MKSFRTLRDMISPSYASKLTSIILLFLFSIQLNAGLPNFENNKLEDAFPAKDISTVNTADIEVYYEFDAVQITESTGSNPIIATISYTLFVTNNGPDEATNLQIGINYHDEVIPYNRVFSSGSWGGYFWAIPNLASGETVEFTESSNIFVPYNEKWVQASLLEMDQDDPDSTPGNWIFTEDDSDMLEIYSPECDLDLTLAANNLEYDIYEYINYEVVVQNFGPSIATDVSASIPLPPGTVLSSQTSATQGSYSSYNGIWEIGSLDIGQTVLLNLVVFTLDADGPKTAFAQVQTAGQPDPDSTPGNDTDQTPDEDDEAIVTVYPVGYSNCSGDITLSSQAEVNAFGPCTIFDGSITITGNQVTDFSAFDGLEEITGTLTFAAIGNLFQLTGFDQLQTIGGSLDITTNADMGSINAFSNLVSIGDELRLFTNQNLIDIQSFDNLQSVHTLLIENSILLTNIDAFSNLSSVQRLEFSFNPSLENIDGLSNVPSSLEFIKILELVSLQNMNGLSHVTDVSSHYLIRENTVLESLDPLSNLTSVGGIFSVELCHTVTNLDALSNLVSVGESVYINSNSNLLNLDGLANLQSVGSNLMLGDNPLLSDCCGLYPLLSSNGVGGTINISNNPSACSSEAEILTTCVPTLCSGDIALTTQAEVDAFDCSEITGNLYIGNTPASDIFDLSPLSTLTSVGGFLVIENNPDLNSLQGLNSLSTVGSWFFIENNDGLTDIDELSSLHTVSGSISIRYNALLENLDGFSTLTTVGFDFFIEENDALTNVSGLSALVSVGQTLAILNNNVLPEINGISSLVSTGAGLWMSNNENLTNISGFSSYNSIGGDLSIRLNPSLISFEISPLLHTLGASLRIEHNGSLLNLDGISGITTIDNNLWIYDNASLSDCCGIYSLLNNNGVAGSINIYNNPNFCSSPAEILSNCAPADYCDSYADFPWHEWISRVQLNAINNASSKSSYSDFTSISTTLVKGDIYPIDLELSFSYTTYDEYLRVWIDYNQNGLFTDPGEMAFNEMLSQPPNGTAPVSVTGNIAIPSNAMNGNTRMRVALQRGSAPTPCSVIPFGEVEDYTVNLSGTSPPELTLECPPDIYVSLPAGSGGDNVTWNLPTYSTTCPGGSVNLVQTGGQPNGSFFPIGIYQIVFVANDDCSNEETCFFTIYVEEVSDYCESQSEAPWHDWMSRLTFAGIDNPSGKSKYSDFTSMTATVVNGNSYPLSLEASYSYTTYDEYWKVWIDYNHNNAFEEPSEVAFAGILSKPPNGTDSKTLDGLINIPADAMGGSTRMRVAMKRGSYTMPCEVFPFGEVEDYTINISSTIASSMVSEEMLQLNASLEDASIAVQWLTNTSYKNDYYVVERSTDGNNFEVLMEVANEGQTAAHIYYHEQDLHPEFGLNHYRIKQYAKDGSIKYSNIQTVRYALDPDQFELFPNPTKGSVFVNLAKLIGQSGRIQIYDAFGRKVLEQKLDEIPDYPIAVDLDGFENGLYFLSVQVAGRKLVSKRFMVSSTR